MSADTVGGVYAAPLMPLTAESEPDLPRYLDHCRWLLAEGCDGLMPLGSTGEAHSFTVDERRRIIDALADSDLDTGAMLIGTSALALPDAARLARHAVDAGAARICVQPAFYYKPTDDGLYGYYAALIEAIGDDRTRMLIYDWAANTGVHFSLDVLDRLYRNFPGVILGIKDSNADADQVSARGAAFPDKELFGGTDAIALAAMRAGGRGLMSAGANVLPRHLCGIYRHWRDADGERLQAELDTRLAILKREALIPAMKAVTAARTGEAGWTRVRPPLFAQDMTMGEALKRELDAMDAQAAA